MHLGLDLGTTRTVVAHADRGNYPVVAFTDTVGDSHDYLPSVVADDEGTLVYAFAALEAADHGAPLLRSFKRLLADPQVGPGTTITIGSVRAPISAVLTGFLTAVREALLAASSLTALVRAGDGLGRTVVGVPAHAHGAQRYLTLQAAVAAGFDVAGLVNEPSAASLEFAHRQARSITSRRNRVVVYDLGGGTFDASLVQLDGVQHEVLGSLGINRLGGDDFDEVLAEAAARTAGRSRADLGADEWTDLLEQSREAKERISPQTRRVALDVAGSPVTVDIEAYYDLVAPLVERSVDSMAPLVPGLGDPASPGPVNDPTGKDTGDSDGRDGSDGITSLATIAGIYVVGGSSGLPLVPRMLRSHFGRRVFRAPQPAASTAIGLAIAADPDSPFSLRDRLSRGFGVFRERDGGRYLGFDQLVDRDAELPRPSIDEQRSTGEAIRQDPGVVVAARSYLAAHNVGWYRFVEYTRIDAHGEPRGDVVPYAEVRFPFDPDLQAAAIRTDLDSAQSELAHVEVTRREHGPRVEETYLVDANGIISVRITDTETGYTQLHALDPARDSDSDPR